MLRTAPAGSVNSGEKTVDATIYTGSGFLTGVLIISDDTNDPQVILYDNTAASGTKIFEMQELYHPRWFAMEKALHEIVIKHYIQEKNKERTESGKEAVVIKPVKRSKGQNK